MNELKALAALIPLAFVTLDISPKFRMALCWLSVTIASLCLAYLLWLRQTDTLHWAILLPLFAMVISDFIQQRKLMPFSLLSVIFVSLASITNNFGAILIFLVFSDFFLEIEGFTDGKIAEKNRAIKNIYRSLLSLFPLGLTVTLELQGESLIVLTAITIALRVFTWPVLHWINEGTSPLRHLIVGGVSGFALWHALDFSGQPEWSLVWLIAVAVLSLGIKEMEVYVALTLGMFSLSPQLGLLSVGLWPLTLHRGAVTYIIYLFIGVSGALIADASTKIIVENASYAVSFLTALLLARSLVGPKIKMRLWYQELTDFFLACLVIAPFIYFYPLSPVVVGGVGWLFLGTYVTTFVLGKILLARKPALFDRVKNVKTTKMFLSSKSLEFLRERSGPAPIIPQRLYLDHFFDALDSESHLLWLLGALGLALWWGVK